MLYDDNLLNLADSMHLLLYDYMIKISYTNFVCCYLDVYLFICNQQIKNRQ